MNIFQNARRTENYRQRWAVILLSIAVCIMIFIYVISNLRMAFLEKLALITNYKNHGMMKMPLSGPSNPHLEDLGRLQNVNGLGGI